MDKEMTRTGRAEASHAGQGASNHIPNAATVAEFKGPQIFGVVRIVQIDIDLARIEANFSGLTEGFHGWSINEYGDLTRGAASTGNIYDDSPPDVTTDKLAIGDLGVLVADSEGNAEYAGSKIMANVANLVGRAVVVYASENKDEQGIIAAVIAWSGGSHGSCKSLCACDGTPIWDYTITDFGKDARKNGSQSRREWGPTRSCYSSNVHGRALTLRREWGVIPSCHSTSVHGQALITRTEWGLACSCYSSNIHHVGHLCLQNHGAKKLITIANARARKFSYTKRASAQSHSPSHTCILGSLLAKLPL